MGKEHAWSKKVKVASLFESENINEALGELINLVDEHNEKLVYSLKMQRHLIDCNDLEHTHGKYVWELELEAQQNERA